MHDFQPPVPIFRSFDEAKARAFYLDFLEFKVVFEHRFEPGFPLYMGVRRDAFVLHLSEHYGDAAPGSSVRVDCSHLDAFCKLLNDKQTSHARPGITDQPWGRDMTINDPFGNRIIFSEPSG